MPEAHPLAGRQELSIRELADEPMILLDLPPASESVMDTCKLVGITPNIRYRAMTLELTRALVGRGLGYALLAQRGPGRLTGKGRAVAAVKLSGPVRPLDVVLVQSPVFSISNSTNAFISLCREMSDS
uniref:LysR substrate-binding domain-containing protein n=1 Tax=unclassified Rhodococcus (in: high G+C Gram-positive bacteria) TaxID=192944 RepID=UPI0034E943DE